MNFLANKKALSQVHMLGFVPFKRNEGII